MKNLDNLFVSYKKSHYSDDVLALITVLPCFNMAMKLMNRKQSGKKPFSKTFKFEERMVKMNQAYQVFENAITKKEGNTKEVKDALLSVRDTITKASKEIKMESLKNDYIYLASIFEDSYNLLSSINS